MITPLDAYTCNHLATWLIEHSADEFVYEALDAMIAWLEEFEPLDQRYFLELGWTRCYGIWVNEQDEPKHNL